MTMPKSKKPKTHFGQVPLEIIKEIAVEVIPDDEIDQEDLMIEPSKSREPHSQARGRRGQRLSANRGRA